MKKVVATILVLGVLGVVNPSGIKASSFPIPKETIVSIEINDETFDSMLSVLEDYDVDTNIEADKGESQNPFAMPEQVEKGIETFFLELEKEQEKKERKNEIENKIKKEIQKEKEEKIRLARLEAEKKERMNTILQSASGKEPVKAKVEINKVLPIVESMSKKYDVPVSWILAVIEQESGFNINATNVNTNGTGDRGLMQLNSNTAPVLAKQIGIEYFEGVEFDPNLNIEMGTLYLSYLKNKSTDRHYVFTSYNRGEGGAKRLFLNQGSYQSTYSISVMQRIAKYEEY